MNPLTNVKNLQKLNQRELELGLTDKKSWHDKYKDSAWIFIGGLPYDLTEGDIICVFSQYGEVVNINLVRDKKTGKSKGFCFLCYEDQRSTILAVDNFNSIKLLGRTLRVDHVEDYKQPKEHGDEDETTLKLRAEGCAPMIPELSDSANEEEESFQVKVKAEKGKKVKKEKKEKKKKKRRKKEKSSSSESDSALDSDYNKVRVKEEKYDPGYERALNSSRDHSSSKRSQHSEENGHRNRHDRGRGDLERNTQSDRKRRLDDSDSSEETMNEKHRKRDERYDGGGRFGRDNRDKYRYDDMTKYRADDLTKYRDDENDKYRDKYRSNERDKYRSDDRETYRNDGRVRYRNDERDKYRSDVRDKYGNDDRDKYINVERDTYRSNDRDKYGMDDRDRRNDERR